MVKRRELEWKKRSYIYCTARAARAQAGKARFGEPEYQLLPQWVGAGAVAVDVGANVGFYTFRLAGLVGKTGLVVAVEPMPLLASRLEVARRLLRLQQVRVLPRALGGADGTAHLTIPKLPGGRRDDGQGHLSTLGECRRGYDYSVSVTSLDRLVHGLGLSRLDFLKIDIEGAEMDCLEGASEVLDSFAPVCLVESQRVHSKRYGRSPDEVFELMRSLNYQPYSHEGGQLRRIEAADDTLVNYIFLPRGH